MGSVGWSGVGVEGWRLEWCRAGGWVGVRVEVLRLGWCRGGGLEVREVVGWSGVGLKLGVVEGWGVEIGVV